MMPKINDIPQLYVPGTWFLERDFAVLKVFLRSLSTELEVPSTSI